MPGDLPLGRPTTYADAYDPSLLHPISRADSRADLGLTLDMPFHGQDLWNAWDLTWLTPHGQPRAAAAVIRIPASSSHIIESKSMKLYLNSLSMTSFDNVDALSRRMEVDLSRAAGGVVGVAIEGPASRSHSIAALAGEDLDRLDISCGKYQIDASLLATAGDAVVDATLYTHAFRSLCPVTGQPDLGSVAVRYSGPAIRPDALLRYLVSYRQHEDFHEACVERMFVDIIERCAPQRLSVYARFQRRGGIDINPFRTNGDDSAVNLRLWRQ